MLHRNGNDIACTGQPGSSVSYTTFGLETPCPQPLVRHGEALAAVVVLAVVDPDRASILKDRAVLRNAVRSARKEFRKVEGRVGFMTHADEENLSVQIVHATDRAFRDVGRKGKRVRGDLDGSGTLRREGMELIASSHAWQSTERLRNNAEARRCWRSRRVKGFILVPRPRRHDQGALGTERIAESLDQTERPSLDGAHRPKGCVHEQSAPLPDSECPELTGHFGSGQLLSFGLPLDHLRFCAFWAQLRSPLPPPPPPGVLEKGMSVAV